MTKNQITIFDTTLREVGIENADDLIGNILNGLKGI